MAEFAAMHARVPTLFVSLEMSAIELGDRLLCSVAEVNGNRLRNGTISQVATLTDNTVTKNSRNGIYVGAFVGSLGTINQSLTIAGGTASDNLSHGI